MWKTLHSEDYELCAQHGLTKIQKRVLDAGEAIRSEKTDQVCFLHTVLCHAGFPRKQITDRVFERRSGHISTLIEAGSLFNGQEFVEQPLPSGPISRLIMVHISTEAVRTGNPRVEIGANMRQFLKSLGMPTSGGARGGYAVLRKHMEALAACRLTLGMFEDGKAVTVDATPVKRFEAWVKPEKTQRARWPGTIELSEEFFRTLCEHAVPLDGRALSALRHSSLALDIYTWLAHRLRRVRSPSGTKLSWNNLRLQFGQEYRCSRDFKRAFRKSIRQVLVVYPDARVIPVMGGVMLYPSRPPVERVLA